MQRPWPLAKANGFIFFLGSDRTSTGDRAFPCPCAINPGGAGTGIGTGTGKAMVSGKPRKAHNFTTHTHRDLGSE